jgi:hypothetical protein
MKPPEEGDWLRRLLAIETRVGWIAFVQQPIGQLALGGIALLATYSHFGLWAAIVAVAASLIAGATLIQAPRFHVPVLFTATWSSVLLGTALGDLDTADHIAELMQYMSRPTASAAIWATVGVVLMLPLAMLLLAWIRRTPQSLLARRPFLTLLCIEIALCVLAVGMQTAGLNDAALTFWTTVFVFTPYLWFLPYAVTDLRTRRDTPLMAHLAVQRPFWSPSYLPFGKGMAFLRKHQAADAEALAVTQTKGLKLLLWANLLSVLRTLLGEIPVPSVTEALDAFLNGTPISIALGWTVLIISTARFCLQIAIWAHLFIGIARLAGYRLPRGSWRPLESRTLMDYFNRFHYYFKEILVDFFFTPTFFKIFKRHPRLRMFFATFMAAGVGNALWHFLRDIDLVATLGPAQAMQTYASYLFYCAVLATGIGISQVRLSLGIKPPGGIRGRLQSFVLVWSFVVTLHVFSDGSRTHGISERMHFLVSLFGVI